MDRSRTPQLSPKLTAKTAFFAQIPKLGELGTEVLSHIAARVSQHGVARRESLWSEGEESTHLYWVRSGVIREVKAQGVGREYVLGFYGRWDVVGEVSVLKFPTDGTPRRTTTAIAHEEATLYTLPMHEIEPLAALVPALALWFAAISATRRSRLEERLVTGTFRSANARIAAALLDLGSTFGVRDSRGIIVNLRLTHKELAGLAGASRETASLALLEWRRDNLLLVEAKRVVLLDVKRLLAIARDEGDPKAIPLPAEER